MGAGIRTDLSFWCGHMLLCSFCHQAAHILCLKSDKFINQSLTCMYLCFSDVFFGGEALTAEQPQSFTCPYCSKMGYTEALLQEHVTGEHADTSNEVVNK